MEKDQQFSRQQIRRSPPENLPSFPYRHVRVYDNGSEKVLYRYRTSLEHLPSRRDDLMDRAERYLSIPILWDRAVRRRDQEPETALREHGSDECYLLHW